MKNRIIAWVCIFSLALTMLAFAAEEPVLFEEQTEEVLISEDEDVVLKLTIEDARDIAAENSYAISSIKTKIMDVEKTIREQKDAQSDMKDLLRLPLEYMPSNIINDYANALLVKKGYGVKAVQVQHTVLLNALEQTKEAVEIGAEIAYYNVLMAKKAVELNKLSYENALKHLNTAKIKFDLGTITRLEVLKAELSVNSAKKDLNNAEDELNIKKLEFNNTIGLEFDKEVDFISEIIELDIDVIDLFEAIEIALENRPEMKNKKAEIELKEIEHSAITSYYTPGLIQYKVVVRELEEAEYYYSQTFKDVEMDVRNKYLEIVKAERALENMEETIALSKEALRITELFYLYDMATLQEVTDAEVSLTQAEIAKYQLQAGYNIARLMFENAISVGMPR